MIDTHTACGYKAYKDYARQTNDDTYAIILSTASPYKFSQDVLAAVSGVREADGVKAMYRLSALTGEPIPAAVDGIEKKPIKKESVIDIQDMARTVLAIIKGEDGHV